jgi:hypothetical protein
MDDKARRRPVVDQVFGANNAPIREVLDADFAELARAVADAEAMCGEVNTKPKTDAEQAALGDKIVDMRRLYSRVDADRAEQKAPILDAGREIDGWFNALKARIETAVKPLSAGADAYVRQKAAEARAQAQREAEEARARAEEERRRAERARSAAAAGRADGRAEALDAQADQAEAMAAAQASDLTRARIGGVTTSARETYAVRIDDYHAAIQPLGALGPYLKREHVEAGLLSMVRVQKDAAKWPGVIFYKDMRASFRK